MKNLFVSFILIFSFICSYSLTSTTFNEEKIIRIVQSNPKVIEYFGLFQNKKDSASVMYIEGKERKLIEVYVGEKFFKENRYIRFATFYYNLETKDLFEYNSLDDSKKKPNITKHYLVKSEWIVIMMDIV